MATTHDIEGDEYISFDSFADFEAWLQEGGWQDYDDWLQDTGVPWAEIEGKAMMTMQRRVFIR